jgi:GNAT superfamily N-acetyltransferase
MIREMEEKDIPYLIDLGYKMHQEGTFKNLDYDREKCKKLGNTLLTNPDFKCFISEDDKGYTGMMIGYITTYYFNHQKFASDLLLYVDPEKRGGFAAVRLIKAIEKWAKTRGAEEMRVDSHVGVNADLVKKLYERLKYETIGHTFRKVLGGNK